MPARKEQTVYDRSLRKRVHKQLRLPGTRKTTMTQGKTRALSLGSFIRFSRCAWRTGPAAKSRRARKPVCLSVCLGFPQASAEHISNHMHCDIRNRRVQRATRPLVGARGQSPRRPPAMLLQIFLIRREIILPVQWIGVLRDAGPIAVRAVADQGEQPPFLPGIPGFLPGGA